MTLSQILRAAATGRATLVVVPDAKTKEGRLRVVLDGDPKASFELEELQLHAGGSLTLVHSLPAVAQE